jgi:hypothetical protein
MLQYHHAKFSRNKISPICKLCGEEEEDREHFLLECKTLEENRKIQMVKLYEALEEGKKRGGVHGLKNKMGCLCKSSWTAPHVK